MKVTGRNFAHLGYPNIQSGTRLFHFKNGWFVSIVSVDNRNNMLHSICAGYHGGWCIVAYVTGGFVRGGNKRVAKPREWDGTTRNLLAAPPLIFAASSYSWLRRSWSWLRCSFSWLCCSLSRLCCSFFWFRRSFLWVRRKLTLHSANKKARYTG